MGKNFFYKSILMISIGMLIMAIIILIIDPFQQFKINDYGRGDQRLLNPGIAKNYKYDIAVIGTSTSENILKKDLENLYKKKSINLCLSGSTAYEHRRILDLIIKKNPLLVIYGLDTFSYNNDLDKMAHPIEEFLYSYSKIDKYKYIYNFQVVKYIINIIWRGTNKEWLNYINYWGDSHKYSKKITLNKTSLINAEKGFKNKEINIDNMKRNFDEFIKNTEQNKNINYKIYFPPYASVWWYFVNKYNQLEKLIEFKSYIIEKTKDRKNIQIYDFQNKLSIIDNLDNYKDIVHYGPHINKKIIEMIKEEEGLITSSINVQEEIKKMKEFILPLEEKYDLKNIEKYF